MLDILFRDRVTVRRAGARTKRNKAAHEEVLDEGGGSLYLKCRMDRRARRQFTRDGVEKTADATMIFARDPKLEVKLEDLVVTDRKEVFRVAALEEAPQVFGSRTYFRANLELVRTDVPADKEAV